MKYFGAYVYLCLSLSLSLSCIIRYCLGSYGSFFKIQYDIPRLLTGHGQVMDLEPLIAVMASPHRGLPSHRPLPCPAPAVHSPPAVGPSDLLMIFRLLKGKRCGLRFVMFSMFSYMK